MPEYQLPLNDCRTGDIDLILVSDVWSNSALQIRRFKTIVEWFFPTSSNDPMRLRLHLLVHVNETHFESLIHFDDYNTTDGLMEGLERLVTNLQLISKDNVWCNFNCLKIVKHTFSTSRRVNAKRLAINFNDLSYLECKEPGYNFGTLVVTFHICYVEYNPAAETNDNSVEGVWREGDWLARSVCGQCSNGWLTMRKDVPQSKLSCFFIKELDKTKANRKTALSFCNSVKAKIATFETKEESNFLQTQLGSMTKRNSMYLVHIGLTERKYANAYGILWDSNLPLTFDFPMLIINLKRQLSVKHYAWISHVRSRDGNVTCDCIADTEDDVKKKTQLVICELEQFNRLTNTHVTIQQVRDEHFFKIQTNPEFDYDKNEKTFFSISYRGKYKRPIKMYQCPDILSVPYSRVCDGHKDCLGGEDEDLCSRVDDERSDGHPDCPGGEDEEGCDDVCLETLCDDGTCLPSQWFSNSSRACRFTMSFNGVLPTNLNLTYNNSCSEFCGDMPCVYPKELNHGIVFCDEQELLINSCRNILKNRNWAPRCVNLKGRYNTKLGCSDLSHLENCNTFNCPEGLFKCPSSYCIPVYNLNDGYPDCPYGEDEHVQLVSENLFRCFIKFKNIALRYILPTHVCDNKTHCPRGDDELGCYVTCPAGFQCLAGAVNPAIHPDKIILTGLSEFDIHTKFLNLSGVDLSKLDLVLSSCNYSSCLKSPSSGNLNELVELHASNCNLASAENIFFNPQLEVQVNLIDFSFNKIRIIQPDSIFRLTMNLKILNLSHNLALHSLNEFFYPELSLLDLSFTNITTFYFQKGLLQILNLSHTRIKSFNSVGNTKLGILDVRSTELKINQETSKALAQLSVTSAVYGDSFQICCPKIRGQGIPGDFCFAPQDAISSCEDLLGDQVKRILLWILAVVSVGGNLAVIGFRLVFERKLITKSYRLFVTNLSISDLIMGVYLLIIAGNDVYYREDYIMYESEWRDSPLCAAAGFLATVSCETSALFVLLVTLERFLVIRFPLGPYRIKRVKKYFLLLVSWVVGVVLAVVPLVNPDWGVYSSNGMCLGLPMIRNQESGWMYSFAVFLVLNCILFILIAIGQLAIFQAMSREKRQLQASAHSLAKRRREIMVAKNLSQVVMSNFLCWFPICVIGLMTARGHTFSQQTYGWLAVFVLPLNSAVNPVIYTLPVVYKKWEDFKNGQTRNNLIPHLTAT